MNRNDLNMFREVFENGLIEEGFIWRYQTYIHIDFEHFWYLAIWPKIFSDGHSFNIQFDLSFFNENSDIERRLKQLHSYQCQEVFVRFNFFQPVKRLLPVSKASFQESYDLYRSDVKKILHRIYTPNDACLFKQKYMVTLPDDPSQVYIEQGEKLINILLSIGEKTEALSMLPLMKNRISFLCDFLNIYEQELFSKWPDEYDQQKTENEKCRFQYQEEMRKLTDLESRILENQYESIVNKTIAELHRNAEYLRKAFSVKEIDQMVKGWNKMYVKCNQLDKD